MRDLKKTLANRDDIISFGNMFLIGNGHLGYRGTLEEYSKDEMVALNVVGEYDKYQDKWRESINMPNPFKVVVKNNGITETDVNNIKDTLFNLSLKNAIFSRTSDFKTVNIESERFIPFKDEDIILFKYVVTPKMEYNALEINVKMDLDIYDINGPHFKEKDIKQTNDSFIFHGITNEGKELYEVAKYQFFGASSIDATNNEFILKSNGKNQVIIYCMAKICKEICDFDFNRFIYYKRRRLHINNMDDKWSLSRVIIKGKDMDQFYMDYSIYHLLILGNECFNTSIPARGVSGQTYKGAIFWDTEIFLLPFYTLTNTSVARKLIEYRIKTLDGAKAKAKEFGYSGAFYAWESQDSGLEACSKYNVTDPVTNEPIRTYFNEKQIHISSDIAYAIINYIKVTGDDSILFDGAIDVLKEIAKFNLSYAKEFSGIYHLNDVIGPDEYHERIDDNAFTNYMAYFTGIDTLEILKKYDQDLSFQESFKAFLDKLYLPPIENGLIEQFKGYFELEDTDVETVKSRLRHPRDYWGGKNGVATPTKVIKQADVVTLLALEGSKFTKDVLKENFDFYFKYTEHGSSLSSSMYSIVAGRVGYSNIAYDMFVKSASIDLGTNQKMFAGGIYIGGTHPASNAGAYLSVVYGMAGLKFDNDGFTFEPNLPPEIKKIKFKLKYKGKIYSVAIN